MTVRKLLLKSMIKQVNQIKQYQEHRKYFAVTSELDSREKHKLEQFTITDSEVLPNKYCSRLVKLIGEKPITEGYINKIYKGLWDMDSMVSVINKHWLKSNFPNEQIFSSEEFLGKPLDLKTASNTKLNIENVAAIDFSLKLTSEKVKVPVVVTNEYLENPIFVYKLMEHLFVSRDNPKIFNMLMSVFPSISVEGAETMVTILQMVADTPHLLGEVRVAKRTIIPGNKM